MSNDICIALTKAGNQCKRKKRNGDYCTMHGKNVVIKPIVTITFGDVAENGPGMEQLGKMATKGFTLKDLKFARDIFKNGGYKTRLVNLRKYLPESEYDNAKPAQILIVKKGVEMLLDGYSADELLTEQLGLDWDTKVKMRGRVVNKHARHNLCFADYNQEPDYGNGQGRVVSFDELPILQGMRDNIDNILPNGKNLVAEGNKYHNPNICGIGFHGDGERKKVLAIRLGGDMCLEYQWFQNSKPVGKRFSTILQHGDLYIMSAKAVGTDWKKRRIFTLRHAAGCPKYTNIKT